MSTHRPRVRALIVGASAFALAAVAAGGTFAASNPPTLYACYDAYGNVRMSDIAQCKLPTGGRLVSWSTVGVPGPVGPTGPTGPQGPAGQGSTSRRIAVDGMGTPWPVVTQPGFEIALTCGVPFEHGVAVTVPAGSPEVTVAWTSWNAGAGTFVTNWTLADSSGPTTIPWDTLVEVQVANADAGAHLTAQWTGGESPDPCTYVATY